MNCIENFTSSEICQSNKAAIIDFDGIKNTTISFNELFLLCKRAQKLLKHRDISKGDTILLFEKPSAELYAIVIAALGLGIKILLIEPWMPGKKINSILDTYRPKALFTNKLGRLFLLKSSKVKTIQNHFYSKDILAFKSKQEDKLTIINMQPNDTAILTFTSGTTGLPKGVHRKHQFLNDQTAILNKYLEYNKYHALDLVIFTNIVLINLTLGKGSLILKNPWSKTLLQKLDQSVHQFTIDTLACNPKFLENLMLFTNNLHPKSIHVGGALADCKFYTDVQKKWPLTKIEHVYGSTEAEPVAISDLKIALENSHQKKFYQNLFLGKNISEIQTRYEESILWVTGKNVSPLYEGAENLNKEFKMTDKEGRVWHKMGDRIFETPEGLWYMGRESQSLEDFLLEQKIYSFIDHSCAFIHRNINNQLLLIGENLEKNNQKIVKEFPEINYIIERKIQRDERHHSRIDRSKTLHTGGTLKDLRIFIKERVPLVANTLLALGLILSIQTLYQQNFSLSHILFLMICLILFITELRFMDELKDFEKDKIANPTRPLPSGRISPQMVLKLVVITFLMLIGCSFLSFLFYNTSSSIYLLSSLFWLFLMYKEFFIPKIINKSPIIYAITHQIIIVPIVYFVIATFNPIYIGEKKSIAYAMIILGSFFCYEVGRKMDPNAHPILKTYLVFYGKKFTHIVLALLLLTTLAGAILIEKEIWFIPSIAVIMLTQIKLYISNKKHKDLEGLIALNLIYNIWVIYIQGLM